MKRYSSRKKKLLINENYVYIFNMTITCDTKCGCSTSGDVDRCCRMT